VEIAQQEHLKAQLIVEGSNSIKSNIDKGLTNAVPVGEGKGFNSIAVQLKLQLAISFLDDSIAAIENPETKQQLIQMKSLLQNTNQTNSHQPRKDDVNANSLQPQPSDCTLKDYLEQSSRFSYPGIGVERSFISSNELVTPEFPYPPNIPVQQAQVTQIPVSMLHSSPINFLGYHAPHPQQPVEQNYQPFN